MAVTRLLQKLSVTDFHLTKIAAGYRVGKFISDLVMPRITVPQRFGRYILWDEKAFQYYSSARAMNAAPQRRDSDYDIKSYAMPDGYTGTFAIDDREDESTRGVSNVNLPVQKMKTEQRRMALEREIKCAAVVTNVSNYTSADFVSNYATVGSNGLYGWGNPATDIYADVMNAKEVVADLIGDTPNVLLISRKIRTTLALSPSLQKFALNTVPGAATSGDIPLEVIAKWLGLDKIIVGEGIYTLNGTRTNIWGNAFASLIYQSEPVGDAPIDPTDTPPSFGWTLQLQGYPKVRKYRNEETTSMVGAIDDNYLHLQTSKDAGYFFKNVLG